MNWEKFKKQKEETKSKAEREREMEYVCERGVMTEECAEICKDQVLLNRFYKHHKILQYQIWRFHWWVIS